MCKLLAHHGISCKCSIKIVFNELIIMNQWSINDLDIIVNCKVRVRSCMYVFLCKLCVNCIFCMYWLKNTKFLCIKGTFHPVISPPC